MRIWNKLCDKVAQSRKKNVKENYFEKEIVKEFLSSLNWSDYYDNLIEQYSFDEIHANRQWIADFALFRAKKKDPEILIELKRPTHVQRKKDIRQLATYMKLTDCQFGLYFGEKLELFYLEDIIDGKRIPISVMSIEFEKDDKRGKMLIDLLRSDTYSHERMQKTCVDFLKLNAVCDEWTSNEGIGRIYDFILRESQLSDVYMPQLRSILKVSISKEYHDAHVNEDVEEELQPVSAGEHPVQTQTVNAYHEFQLTIQKTGVSCVMRYFPEDSRYVILAGSKITAIEKNSCTKEGIQKRQELLKDKSVAEFDNNIYTLIKDVTFIKDTPALAGHFCCGRSINALTEWKDRQGICFKDVIGNKMTMPTKPSELPVSTANNLEHVTNIIRRLERSFSISLAKKGKISYQDIKNDVGYVVRISKQTKQGVFDKFWFVYSKSKDLDECRDVNCVFVCKDENTIVVIPERELTHYLERMSMSMTPDGNPIHWHVVILRDKDGKLFLHLSSPKQDLDITNKMI